MKIEIIKSGKNNLVRKITHKNKIYVHKKYRKNVGKKIKYNRYENETLFINFLRKKKIYNLPNIVSTNVDSANIATS